MLALARSWMSGIGAAVGPVLVGMLYDGFGNYTVAMTLLGVVMVVALVLIAVSTGKRSEAKVQKMIAEESAQ